MSRKNDNILSFADQVEEEFIRLYNELGVKDAPAKRQPDMIDEIFKKIYHIVFYPKNGEVCYNGTKSRLRTYDVQSIEEITEKIISLNRIYGGVIKFIQFSDMTGIFPQTLFNWEKANHTSGYVFKISRADNEQEYNNIFIYNAPGGAVRYAGNWVKNEKYNDELSLMRFDVKKKMREAMQASATNATSLDTMGYMSRLNNEPELGRLYEPRKMVLEAQTRRMVTDAELIKLGELSNNGTQLEDKSMDILGI